ncbi:MAG: HDIG domain-containing protein [Candidatus Wildermuthbacteria bacterium]|nr:HDIG domain-containing protein [Candidatus Wildermuthbacteria bacterium]
MKDIPKEVLSVAKQLEGAGFEAYIVGGCVRDLLIGKEPQDWDVATNARPEEIQKIFPKSFYENKFFTVTVLTGSENPTLKEIEITTFRSDAEYADKRRPEKVEFAKTIEEDLSRRDFTINAIALRPEAHSAKYKAHDNQKKDSVLYATRYTIFDPFGGQKDIKAKFIRAVGNPKERFAEDALRMMRGVRFYAQLGFEIEKETKEAIAHHANLLKEISQERIRDELSKIIKSDRVAEGIDMLRELGLLAYSITELQEGWGVTQNKHHIYTVWEHNLKSVQYAAEKKFSFEVRLASLLHDIGKPRTKRGDGPDSTFYGHQVVGAKMARKILERLKFPKETVDKITLLIREHMFVYDPETVTLRGVRRLVARVGVENIDDLFEVREADRIGSGVPKAQPYRLRHLKAMVEKVKTDPVSPKMLNINGNDVMEFLGIRPGPKVGAVLSVLLEEVLDDPSKNAKELLVSRAKELGSLAEKDLIELASKAKQSAEAAQQRIDEEIKGRYFVK